MSTLMTRAPPLQGVELAAVDLGPNRFNELLAFVDGDETTPRERLRETIRFAAPRFRVTL